MNDKGSTSKEIKDILLEDVSICIKHLHFISTPNSIDSNGTSIPLQPASTNSEHFDAITNETPSFQALIFQLDMILLHDLHRVDRGYWPFLKTFSHNNVITSIGQLKRVKTGIGRGRAWLHIALNDHLMESYFRLFLEDSKPIRSYYRSEAFIRDSERMKLLQTLVSGLDFINFALKTNCEYLDKRACLSEQFAAQQLQFSAPSRARGRDFHSERDLESSISSIASITTPVSERKSPLVVERETSPFMIQRNSEDLEGFISKNRASPSAISYDEVGDENKSPFIEPIGVSRPIISSKRHYFSQVERESYLSSSPANRMMSLVEEIDDNTGDDLVTHVGKGRRHRKYKKRENTQRDRLKNESHTSTWSQEDTGGSLADNSSLADTTSLTSDIIDHLEVEHNNAYMKQHKKSGSVNSDSKNESIDTGDLKSTSPASEIVIIAPDYSSEDLHSSEASHFLQISTKQLTDISSLEEISIGNDVSKKTLSDTSSYDAVVEIACEKPQVQSNTSPIESDSSFSNIIERLEANKTASESRINSNSPSPIQEHIDITSADQEQVITPEKPQTNPFSLSETNNCSDTESEQHSKERKQSPSPNSTKPSKLDVVEPKLVDANLVTSLENKDFEGLLAGYLDTAKEDVEPSVPTNFAAFYSLDQEERVTTEKVVGVSLFDPSVQDGIDGILEGSIREEPDEPRSTTPLSFVDLNLGGEDMWGVSMNEVGGRERTQGMFGEDETIPVDRSHFPRPDREIKPVEEVRISHNNQLMLRVNILLSQEEEILKVFRAFDSQYLGLFRIIYILITDRALYTMVQDGVQGTFCKQEAISYQDLDYVTIGINWQLITVFKKNFTTITYYTGNEQLSKCLLAAIRQGITAGMYAKLCLNVVENDKKRVNKLCSLLELKDAQELKHFSIVTSGPLRGKFVSADEEKDPEGYNHDKGLSSYLSWRKPGMFGRWSEAYFVLKNSTLSQFNLKTEHTARVAINLSGGSAGCRRLPMEGDKRYLMEVTGRDATCIKIATKSEEDLICWIQGICEEVAGREIQESKAHSQSLVMNCGLVLTPDVLCLTLEHEESMRRLSLSYVMDLNEIQVEAEKPYCILKFDSIDWVLCFSSEYELGRFERCLALQWENVYKVTLEFCEVKDPSVLIRANQLMELMQGAGQRSDSITRNRMGIVK